MDEAKKKKKKKNISAFLQCPLCPKQKEIKKHRGKMGQIPFLLNTNVLHRYWERSDTGEGKSKGIRFQIISGHSLREKNITLKLKGYEK